MYSNLNVLDLINIVIIVINCRIKLNRIKCLKKHVIKTDKMKYKK